MDLALFLFSKIIDVFLNIYLIPLIQLFCYFSLLLVYYSNLLIDSDNGFLTATANLTKTEQKLIAYISVKNYYTY